MSGNRGPRRRGVVTTIVAVAVATGVVGWLRPAVLDDLGCFFFDTWQRIEARPVDPDLPVRLVAIDEASLTARGQWPWPRTRLAELTRRLAEAGAASIVFDVILAEPDRSSLEEVANGMAPGEERAALERMIAGRPTNDTVLAETIAAAPVVLGATATSGAGGPPPAAGRLAKAGVAAAGDPPEPMLPLFSGVVAPLPMLAKAAPGSGETNWLPDRDQVVRRVPLLVRDASGVLPSLALEGLRLAQGASTILVRSTGASGEAGGGGITAIRVGDVVIDTDAHGAVRPRHRATAPQTWISADRVLSGGLAPEEVAGRIVLVGTTAVGLGDTRATPIDPAVPGVEIHAQMLEGLLAGHLLVRPDWAEGAETILALVMVGLVGIGLTRLPPVGAAGAAALGAAGLVGASFLAFRHDLLLDPALPVGALVATQLLGAVAVWRSERATRATIVSAFGKYLSPTVVDRLAENPDLLKLGGETRDLTVMFCDLRNFTTLSEGLDAAELTAFMNAYLTPLTDAVLEAHGTVDKYIGDAMMAFWNAPLDDPEHCRHAVGAALAIRAALVDFRARRAEIDRAAGRAPRAIEMGLGLARGLCSVGNMGSARRFDYSILGDAANLASRLEGVSKLYAVDVVVAAEVAAEVPDVAWIELDRVTVKGRSAVTTLFTPVGDAGVAASAEFRDWAQTQERFLTAWRAGDFAEAERLATELGGRVDPAWRGYYAGFASRIAAARQAPPAGAWDGVRRLDVK